MLPRRHWQREIARLDAERDAHRIGLILSTHEFPWDTLQALSFALLRTFAVPSIGRLLHETGEFERRTQQRYDDTGLLLERILEFGFDDPEGRAAVRRMNRLHGRYDIGNDDYRYVLATFVVTPKRWLDEFGYRPLTEHELAATTHYYRELGRHMAIRDLPGDFAGFEQLLDDYERDHFPSPRRPSSSRPDPGGRAVADATLELFTTFPLNRLVPGWAMKRFARAVMDDPLREALGYRPVTRAERRLFRGLLRARGRLLALAPARRRPKFARDFGHFRTYACPATVPASALGPRPPS